MFTKDAPQSPFLREALKVRAIDAAKVPGDLMHLADARCKRCEDKDACFAWLAGMREEGAYRWFCPNAQLLDELSKLEAA